LGSLEEPRSIFLLTWPAAGGGTRQILFPFFYCCTAQYECRSSQSAFSLDSTTYSYPSRGRCTIPSVALAARGRCCSSPYGVRPCSAHLSRAILARTSLSILFRELLNCGTPARSGWCPAREQSRLEGPTGSRRTRSSGCCSHRLVLGGWISARVAAEENSTEPTDWPGSPPNPA
jgi:hypothetical protein